MLADGTARPSKRMHDASPNELGLGLSVLAERLRARWPAGELDVVLDEVSVIARALRGR